MPHRAGVFCVLALATASLSAAGASGALNRPSGLKVEPRAFGSCASLVGYAKGHFALTHGWPEPPVTGVAATTSVGSGHGTTATGSVATPSAAIAAGGGGAGTPSFSTTNDQEVGVDEPDIVKTDGSTIFAIAQGKLQAVSVSGGSPTSSARSPSDRRAHGRAAAPLRRPADRDLEPPVAYPGPVGRSPASPPALRVRRPTSSTAPRPCSARSMSATQRRWRSPRR